MPENIILSTSLTTGREKLFRTSQSPASTFDPLKIPTGVILTLSVRIPEIMKSWIYASRSLALTFDLLEIRTRVTYKSCCGMLKIWLHRKLTSYIPNIRVDIRRSGNRHWCNFDICVGIQGKETSSFGHFLVVRGAFFYTKVVSYISILSSMLFIL